MTDKDFDFIEKEEESEEQLNEIATSGNLEEEVPEEEEEASEPVLGILTAEVIAEARRLAESKKGLKIDKFFKKYHLINVSIDRLLHGKLDKDGCLL